MKNRKSKGLTPREKAAAALILPGMALLCTDQLPAAIAGTALLGAGAVVLNWVEIRAKLRKIGSQRPRGAQLVARQPKPVAGMSAAADCPPAVTRAKKKAARLTRRRHTKNISHTSYQKAKEMSR